MNLDYNSLLLSLGFAAAGLSAAMLIMWLSARQERFMLTWAVGVMCVMGSILAYSLYVQTPLVLWRTASTALFLIGISLIFAAADHFRNRRFDWRRGAIPLAVSSVLVIPLIMSPWDGLGFIAYNLAAAVLLIATGYEYFRSRAEAPVQLWSMAVLYAATGVSFGLCAVVLIAEGAYVIGQAPRNWAEDLSMIVSIAGITGVGALSLSLSQTRLARRHRHDAMTDAQTGLRNRRALFDAYRADRVAAETAIVVFDLDDFKDINDRFGHAVGDEVIIRFSDVLMHVARDTDIAARIGGEEFCLVINRTTAAVAGLVAERIREAFAREAVVVDGATLRCTVSAGVAYVARGGESLDSVMRRADEALYAAKRAGRNRVSFPRMAFAAA